VEQRLAELEQRLERAEWRSRMAGAVAVVGVVAALGVAAARPAVTEAPGTTLKLPLRVLDTAGKTRLLVEDNRGGTLLKLRDGDGNEGVGLSCSPEGSTSKTASLLLFGPELNVTHLNAGATSSGLTMRNGQRRASLGTGEDGSHLLLRGAGESTAHLITETVGGQLRLCDQEGSWTAVPHR
jgi:hypothetical protein